MNTHPVVAGIIWLFIFGIVAIAANGESHEPHFAPIRSLVLYIELLAKLAFYAAVVYSIMVTFFTSVTP